jgi:subtilisin family serine protease
VNSPRLALEPLEHRSVPARVLVALAGGAEPSALSAPFAEAVTPLGFGTYRVDLSAGTTEAAAVSHYAARSGVIRAGADAKLTARKVSNDPQTGSQWGLNAIQATGGWNAGTGTGRTVVAVIDTGVDLTHPDLARNLWRNADEIPGNGRDDDANGYVDDARGYDFANNDPTPSDDHGHGTHVAGIIGAVGNNGVGVSGVAWTTTLMPLKFMDAAGNGYTSDAVRAIDYAVANGAKVINNSWGTDHSDPFLADAIGRARAAGVVVVSSAGNDGRNVDTTPQYPAGYARQFDNAVAVAATDSAGRLATYSNFGTQSVMLAAPGSGVLSTTTGGGYGTKSGTSMATPFVSGAVAVLWDANPAWTYRQVLAKLRAATDPLASLSGKVTTGGQLNLVKLLGASAVSPPVSPPLPVPPPPPPTTTRRTLTSTSAAQPIADFRTTRIPFTVTGTGAATDVRVTLSLTHARPSDLHIRLTAPDGRRAVLFNRAAGVNLAGVTFTAPGLSGARATGEWVLEIFDVVTGVGGSVRSASLSFTPTAAARAFAAPAIPVLDRLSFGTFAAFDLLPPRPDAVSALQR